MELGTFEPDIGMILTLCMRYDTTPTRLLTELMDEPQEECAECQKKGAIIGERDAAIKAKDDLIATKDELLATKDELIRSQREILVQKK